MSRQVPDLKKIKKKKKKIKKKKDKKEPQENEKTAISHDLYIDIISRPLAQKYSAVQSQQLKPKFC